MFQRGRFGRSELVAVGRRLRLHRVAKSWSLKRLSEVSGVSVAAIRKIELGESNPGLLTVLVLLEALDQTGRPADRRDRGARTEHPSWCAPQQRERAAAERSEDDPAFRRPGQGGNGRALCPSGRRRTPRGIRKPPDVRLCARRHGPASIPPKASRKPAVRATHSICCRSRMARSAADRPVHAWSSSIRQPRHNGGCAAIRSPRRNSTVR